MVAENEYFKTYCMSLGKIWERLRDFYRIYSFQGPNGELRNKTPWSR